MSVVLDWDWAERTDGNLSAREYRHLVGVILRDVPAGLATISATASAGEVPAGRT